MWEGSEKPGAVVPGFLLCTYFYGFGSLNMLAHGNFPNFSRLYLYSGTYLLDYLL